MHLLHVNCPHLTRSVVAVHTFVPRQKNAFLRLRVVLYSTTGVNCLNILWALLFLVLRVHRLTPKKHACIPPRARRVIIESIKAGRPHAS